MVRMRSTSRLAVATVTVSAAIFTAAAAAATQGQLGGTVELGATKSPIVAPVCPPGVSSSKCTIILTRVTALETIRDGVTYPTKVSQAGTITADQAAKAKADVQTRTAELVDANRGGFPFGRRGR